METENKKVWVKPDRKMSMDELWARFTYDPDYEDDDPAYDVAIYDHYGNPTYGTLCAMYENEHGIFEGPYTMEELAADWEQMLSETEAEYEDSRAAQQVPA